MTPAHETKIDPAPCHHRQDAGTRRKERVGIFTGILLALLPKCPFCIVAYSSTFMLCEKGMGMHSGSFSSLTLILTIAFCAIAFVSIALNYRDQRTQYALLLAASGSALVIYCVITSGGLLLYYLGIATLFSGVWLNASLLSLVRRIKNQFSHDVVP